MFLFNKTTQKFERFVIYNVYFRNNISSRMSQEGILQTSAGTVVIPVQFANIGGLSLDDFVNAGTWKIKDKSFIVKGEVENATYNELIKNYTIYRIVSVIDARKGGLQHIKVGVDV